MLKSQPLFSPKQIQRETQLQYIITINTFTLCILLDIIKCQLIKVNYPKESIRFCQIFTTSHSLIMRKLWMWQWTLDSNDSLLTGRNLLQKFRMGAHLPWLAGVRGSGHERDSDNQKLQYWSRCMGRKTLVESSNNWMCKHGAREWRQQM